MKSTSEHKNNISIRLSKLRKSICQSKYILSMLSKLVWNYKWLFYQVLLFEGVFIWVFSIILIIFTIPIISFPRFINKFYNIVIIIRKTRLTDISTVRETNKHLLINYTYTVNINIYIVLIRFHAVMLSRNPHLLRLHVHCLGV